MSINLSKYEYSVVYIPKEGTDELRPLGVPSMRWRIYLHGLQNILVIFLSPYISGNQHGFYPGRGSMTAWQQVLSEVISSPNIYEFDLRKFFDSINLDYLSKVLLTLGLPSSLVDGIIS